MAKITSINDARRDRLAGDLAARLKRAAPLGSVRADAAPDGTFDGVTLDEWRSSGRKAGRLLGWPVRTVVAPHEQTVFLVDNRDENTLPIADRHAVERRRCEAVNAIDFGVPPTN